jgi:beta-ribofuranosylaminobenzene 5'-phosphate synthase
MFGFGRSDCPQFGGVGVMVDPPAVEVVISDSNQFAVRGSLTSRARQLVEMLVDRWQLTAMPACNIQINSPPDHVGLGVGTQSALAIAAGLRTFLKLGEQPIEMLASSVKRGLRSAVGTYGFQQGGLIIEAGKERGESLGKLVRREQLPVEWRIVLVRPPEARGLSGSGESDAFAKLPQVPDATTGELWRVTNEQMLPALSRADCAAFGEAVYQFGRLAGQCFSAVQGGPFLNSQIANLVDAIRGAGVSGVGQSSWGPTVFAITANQTEAIRLMEVLQSRGHARDHEISIARPNNVGAKINVLNV